MPILNEITVPLISVNDTALTVVNIPFMTGAEIKKGDIILVFETSKTTYDVVAEHDGFIQILCNEGNEYEVSDVVARVYSQKEDIPLNVTSNLPEQAKRADSISNRIHQGETKIGRAHV